MLYFTVNAATFIAYGASGGGGGRGAPGGRQVKLSHHGGATCHLASLQRLRVSLTRRAELPNWTCNPLHINSFRAQKVSRHASFLFVTKYISYLFNRYPLSMFATTLTLVGSSHYRLICCQFLLQTTQGENLATFYASEISLKEYFKNVN